MTHLLISPKLGQFHLLVDEQNAERMQRTIQDPKGQTFDIQVAGNAMLFEDPMDADIVSRALRGLGLEPVLTGDRIELLNLPSPIHFNP